MFELKWEERQLKYIGVLLGCVYCVGPNYEGKEKKKCYSVSFSIILKF